VPWLIPLHQLFSKRIYDMVDTLYFDVPVAHQHFAAHCFNRAWEYLTATASLWHWSQREDVTAQNLSVGYWQVSRVYCLLNQPDNARVYGMQSLKYARELAPFYKGYAYETLARAALLDNNRAIMKTHLERAYAELEQISDEEDQTLLAKDLESIQ
jgi:hypothetical protein